MIFFKISFASLIRSFISFCALMLRLEGVVGIVEKNFLVRLIKDGGDVLASFCF